MRLELCTALAAGFMLMVMCYCSCTGVWGAKLTPNNHNDSDNHNYNDTACLQFDNYSNNNNHNDNDRNSQLRAGPHAVCAACGMTAYKSICEKRLMSYPGVQSATPPELVVISLRLALDAVQQAYDVAHKLVHNSSSSCGAICDCLELMGDSRDQLSLSIATLLPLLSSAPVQRRADIEEEIENALFSTSAALTCQSTCTDGLTEHNQTGPANLAMSEVVNNICAPLVTIALQLVAHLGNHLCSWQDHYSQNGRPSHAQYPSC